MYHVIEEIEVPCKIPTKIKFGDWSFEVVRERIPDIAGYDVCVTNEDGSIDISAEEALMLSRAFAEIAEAADALYLEDIENSTTNKEG
jgi:hypothetical protein